MGFMMPWKACSECGCSVSHYPYCRQLTGSGGKEVMTEKNIRHILRIMEWEKVRGSLNAILSTFWNETEKFAELNKIIDKFLTDVEGSGTLL